MPNTKPDGVENISLVGGALCLDFTNTRHNVDRPDAPDELVSYGAWLRWATRVEAISADQASRLAMTAVEDPAGAAQALESVTRIRASLFHVFRAIAEGGAPATDDLQVLCDAWSTAVGRARLRHKNGRTTWAWDEDADDLTQPLWPVVGSAIRLLESPELARVRFCGGDDCSWMFLDRSKNRRRRWCQMDVCGNRAKARRHYERRGQRGK